LITFFRNDLALIVSNLQTGFFKTGLRLHKRLFLWNRLADFDQGDKIAKISAKWPTFAILLENYYITFTCFAYRRSCLFNLTKYVLGYVLGDFSLF
jgi:hypothetical protein